MKNPIELIVGDLGDKRRWKAYKARVKALPKPYRDATEAIARYANYQTALTDGAVMMDMLEALADLMEASAADNLPLESVVGADAAAFAEDFASNYSHAGWLQKERARLAASIAAAKREQDDAS